MARGNFDFYIQALALLRSTKKLGCINTHTHKKPLGTGAEWLLWDLEQEMERTLLPSRLGMLSPVPSGMWAQSSCVSSVFNKSASGLAKQCGFCWAFKGRGR